MHLKKQTKALSTLISILLILLSAIIGALASYMWVIAPFYFEPENTVDLIITSVNFYPDHGASFDVTVMNPSHSVGGTNITDIYVDSPEFNRTSISASDPGLPVYLDRGTQLTFNCSLSWSSMAGQQVTVHVLSANNTDAGRSVQTPAVKIDVDTYFNASESVQQFNATVTNAGSPISLNLTQILFDFNPVTNLSITLPQIVQPNQTITFTCYVNWEGHVQPLVRVITLEGFTSEIRKDAASTVILHATQIDFDETNTSQVRVTLFNSNDSASYVNITSLTFKHGNVSDIITSELSSPTLPLGIGKNQTVDITCFWNWTAPDYRDLDVEVTAYTQQGFTSVPKLVTTPSKYAGRIDSVQFDLNDLESFSVNLTNRAFSLQPANVSRIEINQNLTAFTSTLIAPRSSASLTCSFNWSNFVGENITVKVHLLFDSNELLLTYNLILPYLEITNASFSLSFPLTMPYINLTVRNSQYTKFSATIVQVLIKNGTTLVFATNSSGYQVNIGTEVGINYSWNWGPYFGENLEIVMITSEGFQVSETFKVQ